MNRYFPQKQQTHAINIVKEDTVMEYVYLLISCTFFSVQFLFRKYYERLSDGSYAAGIWTTLVTSLVMLVYLFPKAGFRMEISVSAIACSLAYSLSSLIGGAVGLIAMRRGKLAVVTMYPLLGGFILPLFWGLIVNGEKFSLLKIFGTVLIVLSIVVNVLPALFSGKEDRGGGRKAALVFYVLCMLQFITNGIISIATSASQKAEDAVSSDGFLLLCLTEIAVFSFLILLVNGLIRVKHGDKHGIRSVFWDIAGNPPMTVKIFLLMILYSALYSVCNGVGNIFSLNCAQTMDTSLQFPLSSALMILMSAGIGFLILREKPDKNDVIRLLLAAGGTACFIL